MASITLTEVWVHNAADLSDAISSDGFGEGGPSDQTRGEIRTYAGGRRRVVRRVGQSRIYSRVFPAASQTLIHWFEDHLGQTVLVRDPQGRRFWATYFEIDVADRAGGAPPDVTISFHSVTYSEVV